MPLAANQDANSRLDDILDALNSSVEKACREMKNCKNLNSSSSFSASPNPNIKQTIKATTSTTNLAAWWRVLKFYFDALGDILKGGGISVENTRKLLFFHEIVNLLNRFEDGSRKIFSRLNAGRSHNLYRFLHFPSPSLLCRFLPISSCVYDDMRYAILGSVSPSFRLGN